MDRFLDIRVGQLVRIARQPSYRTMHLVGEVAFVEEMFTTDKGDLHAIISAIRKEDGEITGSGNVPVRCLVPENDPEWRHAMLLRDVARIMKE